MDRPDGDDTRHAAEQHGAEQPGAVEHGTDQHGTDQHGTDQHGTDQHGTDQHGAVERANPTERPNRNVARGEATRGQLIAIATRMFADRGYEDTSVEAVLREAGVSRGSLYHHFASKEALFEAVAEEVETSVGAQTITAASDATSPVDALRAGSVAWIRLAGDPVVRRILLIDGPSVLGWERWRAMEERHALGLVKAVMQVMADQGKLRPELVDTLAHVLLASINEVALLVARADDRETAMQAGADAIDELLRRLFG